VSTLSPAGKIYHVCVVQYYVKVLRYYVVNIAIQNTITLCTAGIWRCSRHLGHSSLETENTATINCCLVKGHIIWNKLRTRQNTSIHFAMLRHLHRTLTAIRTVVLLCPCDGWYNYSDNLLSALKQIPFGDECSTVMTSFDTQFGEGMSSTTDCKITDSTTQASRQADK